MHQSEHSQVLRYVQHNKLHWNFVRTTNQALQVGNFGSMQQSSEYLDEAWGAAVCDSL